MNIHEVVLLELSDFPYVGSATVFYYILLIQGHGLFYIIHIKIPFEPLNKINIFLDFSLRIFIRIVFQDLILLKYAFRIFMCE